MRKQTKPGKTLLDIIEQYIPAITFTVMFICFVIQIVARYLIQRPQSWTNELISICFIWTIMLGACLALRDNEHVVFSLVYDECSQRRKYVMDLISNGLCAVLFAWFLYPTYCYLAAQAVKSTPILHISYSIVYAPFGIMLLISTVRQLVRAVAAAKKLISLRGETTGNGGEAE